MIKIIFERTQREGFNESQKTKAINLKKTVGIIRMNKSYLQNHTTQGERREKEIWNIEI